MKRPLHQLSILSLTILAMAALNLNSTYAANSSKAGKPILDPPTVISLGLSWMVKGDANRNATITLAYRKVSTDQWINAFPLQRAENSEISEPALQNDRSHFYKVDAPAGTWRFAGSAWDLKPDTTYELKVVLNDPDGGKVEHTLKQKTRAIPPMKGPGKSIFVIPGDSGGSGTKEDPFKGLTAALNAAKPGDNIMLNPGTYARLTIEKNGTAGKPISFIGLPGGEAIVEGGFSLARHGYFMFDNLTIKKAKAAFSAKNSWEVVVRYCTIKDCGKAIYGQDSRGFYVSDNKVFGKSTWPRSKGIEQTAGFDIGGMGHTICYNYVANVADGISCMRGKKNVAIDVYNNEVITCTDDGIELDYADWNMRVFRNRLTNIYQGISFQPIHGGPVFAFRNILYNSVKETFKLHNYASGFWIVHNTSFKKGTALVTMMRPGLGVTNANVYNNLLIGTDGKYGANFGMELARSACDYNALVGDGFKQYIRWRRKGYKTLAQLKDKGPVQAHGYHFTTKDGALFEKDLKAPTDSNALFPHKDFDPRLKKESAALDKGKPMHGFNTGFKGTAPDLGAFELGDELPWYGPRPRKK